MFRKMRRFKQGLTREECVEILKNEPRGVLSLIGDDGYPYGLPMTHYYNADNGKIYFHCARVGHKNRRPYRLRQSVVLRYGQRVQKRR